MKTKIFITLLIIICIQVTRLMASETESSNPLAETETESGIILGRIIDKNSEEPLPFATVALYQQNDSSMVTGVITDAEGAYKIMNVPFGKYQLKLSYLGYKPKAIDEVDVSRNNKKLDLGPVYLDEDLKEIDEVVLKTERLKGTEKIDRTEYTINDDVRNTSSSGLDMLKHIPGVSVDFQENLTLQGRSDIQIYVDGVLRNKDFIAQLDPKRIDKVEIMTNPSVKYDADISGVINIILKKDVLFGVNGSLKLEMPHPDKITMNPRGNIEYGNKNLRVYVGNRVHYERFPGKDYTTTNVMDPSIEPYRYEKIGEGDFNWANSTTNYGLDWFINDETSLNFYGEWDTHGSKGNNFHYTESVYTNDLLTDYSTVDKKFGNTGNSFFYSAYLKKKLQEDGDELTLEANYYDYQGDDDTKYTISEFYPADISSLLSTDEWTEKIFNGRQSIEFKADYTNVTDKVKQEVGYRSYYQWVENAKNLSFTSYPEIFKYNEIRQIGYYNLSGKISKFTLQGGVRLETSLMDLGENGKSSFTKLLPQFSAIWNMEKEQSLKLSFRKQIYRPSAWNLSTVEKFLDSLHIRHGNPDLEPAVDNNLELTYSKNFKSNYISPSLYIRYTNNGMSDYSILENGITVHQQANIVNSYEYGLGVNSNLQILKKWRMNANFTLYNKRVGVHQGSETNDFTEKLSYRIHMTNIISLPKEFNMFTFMYYGSPSISYQREHSRDLLVFFGGERKIGKNFKVEVMYNPFIKNFVYNKVITKYEGGHEEWYGEIDVSNLFLVGITYNFNYGKKIKKINRSTQYEKDGSGGSF